MDRLVDSQVSEAFRVTIPERPTYSLLRSKAGVIGRPIGETSGTVVDQVAARSGVIRVSNGFRCPDDMSNGGTFTDAMGSTCGVRIALGALDRAADLTRGGADKPRRRSRGEVEQTITQMRDAADKDSKAARLQESATNLVRNLAAQAEPSRVRFSADELIPGAVDPDGGVPLVLSRRPQYMLPGATLPLETVGERSPDITVADDKSEVYLRSLGAAVLLESADEIDRRLNERREKIKANISKQVEYEKEIGRSGRTIKYETEEMSKTLSKLGKNEHRGPLVGRYGVRNKDGGWEPLASVASGDFEVERHTFDFEDGDTLIEASVLIPVHKDAGVPGSDAPLPARVQFVIFEGNTKVGEFGSADEVPEQYSRIAVGFDEYTRTDYLAEAHGDRDAWTPPAETPLQQVVSATYTKRNSAKEMRKIEAAMDSDVPASSKVMRDALYETMEKHGFQRANLDPKDIAIVDDVAHFRDVVLNSPDRAIGIDSSVTGEDRRRLGEAIAAAMAMMPEHWQRKLKEGGVLFRTSEAGYNDTERAVHYGHTATGGQNYSEIIITSKYFTERGNLESVVLHEMTHAVQHHEPELEEAEFIAFSRRIDKGTSTVKLSEHLPGSGYAPEEVAVPDDADDAYMFKIYYQRGKTHRPFHVSEVSAMMMEKIYGERHRTGGDLDMLSFMVGLLMEHGTRGVSK